MIARKMLVGLGLAGVLASGPLPASAQKAAGTESSPPEPIVTDRPTVGASAEVVPVQSFQLEAGYLFSRSGSNTDATDTHVLPDLLARYGIARAVEVRLVTAGWTIQKTSSGEVSGFSDISVGAKIALAEERDARPQMGLLVELSLPSGAEEFTNDYVIPKVLFLGANSLGHRLGLTYNIGPTLVTEDRNGETDTNIDLNYAVALSRPVGGGATLFGELYGTFAGGSDRSNSHNFQAGITLLLSPVVQIDVRGGVGLSGSELDWLVGAGLAFRVPR